MFQLFVPTSFEGWGEHAHDGTPQRQLLAVLIVSVGALALTLCVALLMLTDDDLTTIKGSRELFVGKIQDRYGIAKDEARKQIDENFASQGY